MGQTGNTSETHDGASVEPAAIASLKAKVRRRCLLALGLAVVTVLVSAAIPEKVDYSKVAKLSSGESLAVRTERYGQPNRLVYRYTWVVGEGTNYRAARPDEIPAQAAGAIVERRVKWANVAATFLAALGAWLCVLAAGPTYRLYVTRRRLAKETVCLVCGYPKKGLPTPRCPECGTPH